MSALIDIFRGDVKPVPRQTWNAERSAVIHNHIEGGGAGWVELFIDLLYVAQFLLLGHRLHYCSKDKSMHLSEIFGWVYVSYSLFWGARVAIDEFYNKFELPKDFGRLLMLWYTLGIFFMTFNSSYDICMSDDNPYNIQIGFFVGLLITRVTLLYMYVIIVRAFPQAKQQFLTHIMLQSCIVFLGFICLCLLPYNDAIYALALIAALIDTFQVVLKAMPAFCVTDTSSLLKYYHFPIDVEKTHERYGVFIIMVIGEAIITISKGYEEKENIDNMYIFTTGAFMICCAIAGVYFEEVQASEHARHVALRNNAYTGSAWSTLHNPLGFAIFLIGISIKLLYSDLKFDDSYDYSWLDVKALDITVGVCHLLMVFMASLHTNVTGVREDVPDYYVNKTPWWHVCHAVIACNHFWVGNAFRTMGTNPKYITIVHSIIFFAHRLLLDLNKMEHIAELPETIITSRADTAPSGVRRSESSIIKKGKGDWFEIIGSVGDNFDNVNTELSRSNSSNSTTTSSKFKAINQNDHDNKDQDDNITEIEMSGNKI